MLVYQDLISGKDVASDSYPMKTAANGAVMIMESKKITVGDEEINTGANASKEEADEGVDSSKQTVLNIVHAHDLQKLEIAKKEFKVMIKAYWKSLKETRDKLKYKGLGFDEDYKPPKDKKEAKDKEDAAYEKLEKDGKAAVDDANKKLASFKKNFEDLSKFVKDEVEDNFDEFEFYIPGDGASVGSCIIIPARFVGEALTPSFYFFSDGLLEQKF